MVVKKCSLAFVATLTLLLSFSLSAADSATDKLNVFVQTVVTFKANFKQTVIDSQGQVLKKHKVNFY